jgi:hypothetical protein
MSSENSFNPASCIQCRNKDEWDYPPKPKNRKILKKFSNSPLIPCSYTKNALIGAPSWPRSRRQKEITIATVPVAELMRIAIPPAFKDDPIKPPRTFPEFEHGEKCLNF